MLIRCIHNHTIDEHPACFLQNKVKIPEALEREITDEKKYKKLTKLPWWSFPGYEIGYLDIETDGFYADFGNMLCWCIYDKKNKNILSDVITEEDIDEDKVNPDKRIVQSLLDAMKNFKIIVGYNSKFFDVPFVRTRAAANGLSFPNYGSMYHMDLYYVIKSKFRLSKNSLERACELYGIKGKNHINREIWRLARYGNEKALEYVLDHCKRDVVILSKLHDKIIGYSANTRSYV